MNAKQIVTSAHDVLRLFPYGPHLTPDQNRALASLAAAVSHLESVAILDLAERVEQLEQDRAEHNDAIEQLQVWQGQQDDQNYGGQIAQLRADLDSLENRLTG